jgi:hypothetical protein
MNKQVKVNVLTIHPMKKGKVRVKIAQNNVNLLDMNHEGKKYKVVRNLGRGRYIMREE